MHELAIAQSIAELAGESAGGRSVVRVVVEVGVEAAVVADSLRFCFDVVCQDTLLEGAVLEIVELPGHDLRLREMEVE